MYDLCLKSCCSAIISSSLAAEAWPLGQPLPLGFLGAARAQWCSADIARAPAPVRRVRGLGLLVHLVRQVQRRSAAPPLAGVSPTRARGSRRGGAAKLHGGKERRRSRVPRGSYSWTADVAGLISCVSMESDVMLRRGGAPPLRSRALGPHSLALPNVDGRPYTSTVWLRGCGRGATCCSGAHGVQRAAPPSAAARPRYRHRSGPFGSDCDCSDGVLGAWCDASSFAGARAFSDRLMPAAGVVIGVVVSKCIFSKA